MKNHPGGREYTIKLLQRAGFEMGDRIIDMGAGEGNSLDIMTEMKLEAVGIDLEPRGAMVIKGNFLESGFAGNSFDGVLSECSFYVSGDQKGAIRESYRLLNNGGRLVMSDVCYEDLSLFFKEIGFEILYEEDRTELWKEYYIEALWRGDEVCQCNAKGKCRYISYICVKK